MAVFTDKNGDNWVVDLNTTVLKQLRAQGVDLLDRDAHKSGALHRLMEDPIFLIDTIYLLCQEQAEKRGITDEQFGRLVGTGNSISDATGALVDALADFSPGQGEVLKLAMRKIKEVEKRLSSRAMDSLENLDIDRMANQFGKSLTSALESSDLTQAPSSSENS